MQWLFKCNIASTILIWSLQIPEICQNVTQKLAVFCCCYSFFFSAKSWTESHTSTRWQPHHCQSALLVEFLFNMHGCVWFYDYIRYVRISHMCVLPSEGREGVRTPWNCNYYRLCTAMWVLGIKPRSSGIAASAFTFCLAEL